MENIKVEEIKKVIKELKALEKFDKNKDFKEGMRFAIEKLEGLIA